MTAFTTFDDIVKDYVARFRPKRLAEDRWFSIQRSLDDAIEKAAILLALDLEDLDAGPRAGGYVEPSEAAWKALEEAVTPYFHDLERRVKRRHENEAVELCKGIVLGRYRAQHRAPAHLH